MDSHTAQEEAPTACRESLCVESGSSLCVLYRTTGKSCSWPLLVLSQSPVLLRLPAGPFYRCWGCPLSSSSTARPVTSLQSVRLPDSRSTVGKRFHLSDVIKRTSPDLSRRETGTFTCFLYLRLNWQIRSATLYASTSHSDGSFPISPSRWRLFSSISQSIGAFLRWAVLRRQASAVKHDER